MSAVLTLVGLLLTGCGNGYIDCSEGLPFGPVPASDVLPVRVAGSIPADWTAARLTRLSYATPVPPVTPIYEDRKEPANRRCVSWNGDAFEDTANAWLMVVITPHWQSDEAVGTAGGQFTPITVRGADSAVARLSRQPYVDGGGERLKGHKTTIVQVVLQSGHDTYTLDGSFAPGPRGEAVAASLLRSLVIK